MSDNPADVLTIQDLLVAQLRLRAWWESQAISDRLPTREETKAKLHAIHCELAGWV